MIKRLDPIKDEALLREAFHWTRDTPQWHVEMDSVYGPTDADDFLKMMREPLNISFGIFDPDFIGVIIAACASQDVFNSHLMAKRGASLKTLIEAAAQVIADFFGLGMKEAFCWVAEKNRPIRRLCDNLMAHEGVIMYHGTYKGRAIKWLRYSVRAEAVAARIAA